MLREIKEKILSGGEIIRQEAHELLDLDGPRVFELFAAANSIRQQFRGDSIGLCAIVNAKSGFCPENCSYCAQSTSSEADIQHYPLAGEAEILLKAEEAREGGATRFCVVTSGKRPSAAEISRIGCIVSGIRQIGLLPCATLGLLNEDDLFLLKEAGLERFHHNLETSESFFPEICTSHTYQDKLKTIEAVKATGLSLCSGGIFGLGEDWKDRIEMAFALREIDPDSVPINFLMPVMGTKLGDSKLLKPLEALKIISIYRFILPDKEIRVCGGRVQTLGDLHPLIFLVGADSALTGNYLTTLGRSFSDDLRLIDQLGLKRG